MKDGELGKVYSHGEIIFEEGDLGDCMYIIQSGKVCLTKKTEDDITEIATLKGGDVLGEMAVFDRLPRSVTATTVGETRILSIDKKKLFSSLTKDPTVVLNIIENMSRRIRSLNEELSKFKLEKTGVFQACMNPAETCNLILGEIKEHVGKADNGSVMLLDQSDKKLYIVAGFGGETKHKTKLSEGKGVAGKVIKSGQAELVSNVKADPDFVKGDLKFNSLLCVPLKHNGEVFGVINLSSSSDNLFSIEDLNFMNAISIYASIALKNVHGLFDLKKVD